MFDDQNGNLGTSGTVTPGATSGTAPSNPPSVDPAQAQRQAEAEARRVQALSKLGGAAMNPDGTPAGTADLSYRAQLPQSPDALSPDAQSTETQNMFTPPGDQSSATPLPPSQPVGQPAMAPPTSVPPFTEPPQSFQPPDMAAPITLTLDSAAPDMATQNMTAPETATPETATPDMATQNMTTPETATPETATPETATPETAILETATLDASGHDPFGNLAREAANPIQIQPDTALSDEEMADMFRRETLSPLQRTLMFGVVIVVVAIFVGGGIWVYQVLDPFAGSSTSGSNVNETSNMNTQIQDGPVVPLHELDTDGDGLLDINEAKYGTDPKIADTDGDGYNDGSEINGGFDPLNPEG